VNLTPRPYQIEGRDFLASRRFALLADEMRVGKTPQAILAAEKIGALNSLVICPAIAVAHWYREFERWMRGSCLSLTIVSYDRLRNDAKQILACRYDLAIVDECHFAKNPEAQRTKLIYGKGGVGWQAARMWVLSGTPAPKHAAELWPMLYAFGVVKCDYETFIRTYCTYDPLDVMRPTGTRVAAIPELRALLAKIMLRRTRKQVAPDMPDIGFEFLEIQGDQKVDMPGAASDYTGVWLEANPSFDPDSRREVALAKVPALVDEITFAIDNGLLKQTVVFGWHIDPLKELARRLLERGIKTDLIIGGASQATRTRVQKEFREGTLQVICANIMAAGTAIDLSSASHGYFLELDWLSGNNAQAANRLISMDKDEPVTFDICTWPGSVDDAIQRVLVRRVKQLSQLY
jgi:SWI/SNF-related matrix-associated actin-dependent regulator 1 of chromatin subfamily A